MPLRAQAREAARLAAIGAVPLLSSSAICPLADKASISCSWFASGFAFYLLALSFAFAFAFASGPLHLPLLLVGQRSSHFQTPHRECCLPRSMPLQKYQAE